MSWHLQNLNTERFVHQHWQKKPCLIRQAFPDIKSPITAEELAGLACEGEVHSRLVLEKHGATSWQLQYGPFDETTFQALPETHYSLLVSECNKWVPELARLLDQFRFLPAWRIDDLMVSYAPREGSVGPHCDEYDVFLLQASGRRKWRYTEQRVDSPAHIPDLELSIMSNFSYDQEAILEPGDMLYLPPGIAHHGIALDPCMTFSIGFRAPTANDLLDSFLLEVDPARLGALRYTDPLWEKDRHANELTDAEIAQFKSMVLSMFDQPDSLWRDAIGKLLSDTSTSEYDQSEVDTNFKNIAKRKWVINPDCKLLYYKGRSKLILYANGQAFDLPNSNLASGFVQDLCENQWEASSLLDVCHDNKPLATLVSELIAASVLVPGEV